jgi:hypothetical protein
MEEVSKWGERTGEESSAVRGSRRPTMRVNFFLLPPLSAATSFFFKKNRFFGFGLFFEIRRVSTHRKRPETGGWSSHLTGQRCYHTGWYRLIRIIRVGIALRCIQHKDDLSY